MDAESTDVSSGSNTVRAKQKIPTGPSIETNNKVVQITDVNSGSNEIIPSQTIPAVSIEINRVERTAVDGGSNQEMYPRK